MSLNKAFGDSNASPGNGSRPEINASGDSIGMTGVTVVPFPSQMPAQSNSDVGITQDFSFTDVNQGTSVGSYDEQPETVNSETGS